MMFTVELGKTDTKNAYLTDTFQSTMRHNQGTVASKINVTPKCVYLPILKQHSILAVVNLLAHNNINQICYCGQISLECWLQFFWQSDTFGGNIYFAGDDTHSKRNKGFDIC